MVCLLPRLALPQAIERLSYARGVVVNGPRQSGKTELLRMIHDQMGGSWSTLDNLVQLKAARSDPQGFVADRATPIFIDEIQRGGDPLVLTLKERLDNSRDPAQVVLAGSTRFLTEPRLSESLAGRIRFVDLWPLSQLEIEQRGGPNLAELLVQPTSQLRDAKASLTGISRPELYERVCTGGFPEAVLAPNATERQAFFENYVRTLSQRDIHELGNLGQRIELPTVLRVLARETAGLHNASHLAERVGLPHNSMRRYLPLLETIFLIVRQAPWSRSHAAKSRRRPKLHLVDAGLAASLCAATPQKMLNPGSSITGQLVETFAFTELLKLVSLTDEPLELSHYRDDSKREVDIVLEHADGRVAAIEIKAAVSVDDRDIRHLAYFRDYLGDQFANGIILHAGDQPLALGDRITALPFNALWS